MKQGTLIVLGGTAQLTNKWRFVFTVLAILKSRLYFADESPFIPQ